VAGSFCDDRFNLAAGGGKLAGTAQSWRCIAGESVVLAQAVIETFLGNPGLQARAPPRTAARGSRLEAA